MYQLIEPTNFISSTHITIELHYGNEYSNENDARLNETYRLERRTYAQVVHGLEHNLGRWTCIYEKLKTTPLGT